MRKVVTCILIVVVAIAAVSFGLSRAKQQAAAKVEVGRVVTAKRGDIKVTVSENGTLEPVTQVEVKSRVAGRVLKIYVTEGMRVKVGDPIALIDPTEVTREADRVKAQLAAARAGLASSESALVQAEENYRLTKQQNALSVQRAQASLTEAQRRLAQAAAPNRTQEIQQQVAAVERAKASLQRCDASLRRVDAQIADAKRNFERQDALVKKGFVAQSNLDSAQTSLELAKADRDATLKDQESAQAELHSANERLSLLKEGPRAEDIAPSRAAVETTKVSLEVEKANAAQAEMRKRDVEQARANVERSRAEVTQIENQLAAQQIQLTETRIVAPRSGEITGKYMNEGELVASATAGFAQGAVLVRIADLSKMQVKVNINEVDVVRVHVGQPVEIRVDGIPDQTFRGRVASIAPSSLTANSTSSQSGQQGGVVRFEVKVAVETPDLRLRPGMTAAVNIILDQKKNIIILPSEALGPNNAVTVVTGTGDKQTKNTRTVTVGMRGTAEVEVQSGLKEGEIVEVPKVDAKDRRKINVGPD